MKKIMSLIMVLILIFPAPVFANTKLPLEEELEINEHMVFNDLIEMTIIDDDTFLFVENGEEILVSNFEDDYWKITTIENLDTKEIECFTVDKINNTIHSSITDVTLELPSNTEISTFSSGPYSYSDGRGDIFLRYEKMYFSTMSNLVSGTSSIVAIAVAVAGYFSWLSPKAALIATAITHLVEGTLSFIIAKYPNGYIRMGVYSHESEHSRGSDRWYTRDDVILRYQSFGS